MSDELKTLRDVVKKLNSAKVPYMLTGSIAMSFYAVPRMTRDIDLVVELRATEISNFVSTFEKDYYVDAEMIADAVKQERMFNLIHNATSFKIDCIIRKSDTYEETKFGRRLLIDFGGFEVQIISAEDLVLSKLMWAKDSMSEVQLRDVQNILSGQKKLDLKYLKKWAKTLEVDELLSGFLKDL